MIAFLPKIYLYERQRFDILMKIISQLPAIVVSRQHIKKEASDSNSLLCQQASSSPYIFPHL